MKYRCLRYSIVLSIRREINRRKSSAPPYIFQETEGQININKSLNINIFRVPLISDFAWNRTVMGIQIIQTFLKNFSRNNFCQQRNIIRVIIKIRNLRILIEYFLFRMSKLQLYATCDIIAFYLLFRDNTPISLE